MFLDSTPIVKKNSGDSAETHRENEKRISPSFQEVLQKKNPIKPIYHRPERSTIFDLSKNEKKVPSSKPKEKEKNKEPNQAGPTATLHEIMNCSDEMNSIAVFASSLSADMNDLLEKMVDFIEIESHNGISTTTILIEMNNSDSLFHHSQIIIEHYDTAPHSFTIQLCGSSQAVTAFDLHLPTLFTSLQNQLINFQIHLLPSILSEQNRPNFKTSVKEIKKTKQLETQIEEISRELV